MSRSHPNESTGRDADARFAERLGRVRAAGRTEGTPIVPAVEDEERVRRTIGRRIRELRTARGLTSRQLAEQARVSQGMISQVELGVVMPSIATLLRISTALGANVGDVIEQAAPAGRVVRASDRVPYTYPLTGVHDELISSDPTGRLQVFFSRLDPGATSGPDLLEHGSEAEFVLVLRGEAEIVLGSERVLLERGDSITFAGNTPHGFANPRDEPADLIWVTTPASY